MFQDFSQDGVPLRIILKGVFNVDEKAMVWPRFKATFEIKNNFNQN